MKGFLMASIYILTLEVRLAAYGDSFPVCTRNFPFQRWVKFKILVIQMFVEMTGFLYLPNIWEIYVEK